MEVVLEVGGCDPEELLLPSPALPDDAPPEEEPPDEAGGAVPDDPLDPPLLTSPDDPLLVFTSRFADSETDEDEEDASGEFEGDPASPWAGEAADELADVEGADEPSCPSEAVDAVVLS